MNIISMSLWGDKHLYTHGAIENANLVDSVFPGWTLRIYHDNTVPTEILRKLSTLGCDLVEREPTVDALGMFWRFEPAFDTGVGRFIVRDADSRINKRDFDAVMEWVESDKCFHIIRDCESHNVPILGGTWGAKSGSIPGFRHMMRYWLQTKIKIDYKNPRGMYHGQDQMFLWNMVWPLIESPDLHCAHIRASDDMPPGSNLRFTGHEIELPPLDGGVYIGQVC